MFTYRQSTGELTHPQLGRLAVGYAGSPAGKNDPAQQHIKNTGPLPRGHYTVSGPEDSHGGFTLRLRAAPTNEMFGRDGFLIHGDSVSAPGTASQGCIILPRLIRWAVWGSGDRDLVVVE